MTSTVSSQEEINSTTNSMNSNPENMLNLQDLQKMFSKEQLEEMMKNYKNVIENNKIFDKIKNILENNNSYTSNKSDLLKKDKDTKRIINNLITEISTHEDIKDKYTPYQLKNIIMNMVYNELEKEKENNMKDLTLKQKLRLKLNNAKNKRLSHTGQAVKEVHEKNKKEEKEKKENEKKEKNKLKKKEKRKRYNKNKKERKLQEEMNKIDPKERFEVMNDDEFDENNEN